MSRTRKDVGSKPNVEFHAKRPGNKNYMGSSGVVAKKFTHRRERIQSKREAVLDEDESHTFICCLCDIVFTSVGSNCPECSRDCETVEGHAQHTQMILRYRQRRLLTEFASLVRECRALPEGTRPFWLDVCAAWERENAPE